MNQHEIMEISEAISDKLINVWKEGKTKDKKLLDLYNGFLEEKHKEYKTDILSYIPKILAVRGYVIVNNEYFQLEKY